MTEEQFRTQLQDWGYGEPRIKEFEPNLDGDMHAHDFSVFGLVTRGRLTLAFEGSSATYAAGECCELAAGTVHREQTGADGATFLLATK